MKLGQLFREMIKEAGQEFDEKAAQQADLCCPEAHMIEVNDVEAAILKELLRPEVEKLLKRPVAECAKHVKAHLEKN